MPLGKAGDIVGVAPANAYEYRAWLEEVCLYLEEMADHFDSLKETGKLQGPMSLRETLVWTAKYLRGYISRIK